MSGKDNENFSPFYLGISDTIAPIASFFKGKQIKY
jgi:hypothetical protein